MTAETVTTQRRTFWQQAKYVARRAIGMELAIWVSLYRFIFRKPAVPAGADAFSYHRPILSVMIIFIVLSAVEIPVVDMIVHGWPYIRIPFLILGIWGLTWMLGFLFGYLTSPHTVGPAGIRVRDGAEVVLPISWDDLHAVEVKKEVAGPEKVPKLSEGEGGAILHLRVQNETNLAITLERPVEFRLPQGPVTVREIRFHADEPKRFMDAVRHHLDRDHRSSDSPGSKG